MEAKRYTTESYIKQQEENILFIEERIKIQNEPNYNPFIFIGLVQIKEKQYTAFDIEVIKTNIDRAKETGLGIIKRLL